MISAIQALKRLQEGNGRFVSGTQTHEATAKDAGHRRGLLPETKPIAAILGCSDSRVPVETVFDQSIGDLFVVRVAGNIAGSSQIGSIEFAVKQFGTPLVVVLGHSLCGAVIATIENLRHSREYESPFFGDIVNTIRPAVEGVSTDWDAEPADDDVTDAVRANISAAVARLKHDSALLGELLQQDQLSIVGAEYALDTGIVEFLP